MGRRDILLIAALLFAGTLTAVLYTRKGEGSCFTVTVDGYEYGRYSIYEEGEIPVETEYGYNCIMVKAGKVYMEKADCPDKYCMQQHSISKTGETIVCLPHRLVVEVENGVNTELDALAK